MTLLSDLASGIIAGLAHILQINKKLQNNIKWCRNSNTVNYIAKLLIALEMCEWFLNNKYDMKNKVYYFDVFYLPFADYLHYIICVKRKDLDKHMSKFTNGTFTF